jgi:LDH2 family malate/lactate/ureidoglycolate dehydrogenase
MNVAIAEVKEKMTAVLTAKGYTETDIPFLINMYLGGDLRGHTSHGLASFAGFVSQDYTTCDEPVVLKQTNALFMIDAKSNPGAIVGKRAADEAIKRARREVIGTALIKNMDSWLRPGAIAQYIADQGLFAIVTNDGGGASIAPPGGYDPVVATNPIAYGIPTEAAPLVVDLATSKRAWGQVRLANKYGTDLPPDTFYNDKGEVTRNPKEAHSVMPAGEYKGFALALLIEVLCGSLVGMDMMVTTNNAGSSFGARLLERGAFILVIDPDQTSSEQIFKAANSDLLQRIKATRPLKEQQIRIPGEEAGAKESEGLRNGYIDIPETLWKEIQNL